MKCGIVANFETMRLQITEMMTKSNMRAGVFFGLCLFANCKKEEKVDYPLTKEVKEYFDYKPGTYWIMRDSISGQIDSFSVIENKRETYQSRSGKVEGIGIIIKQFSANVTDTVSWGLGLDNNFTVTLRYSIYSPTSSVGYTLFPQFTPADSLAGTMSVLNISYDDVLRSRTPGYKGFQEFYDAGFYLNKQVGFIKMKLTYPDTVNWELLNSNIIK